MSLYRRPPKARYVMGESLVLEVYDRDTKDRTPLAIVYDNLKGERRHVGHVLAHLGTFETTRVYERHHWRKPGGGYAISLPLLQFLQKYNVHRVMLWEEWTENGTKYRALRSLPLEVWLSLGSHENHKGHGTQLRLSDAALRVGADGNVYPGNPPQPVLPGLEGEV